MAITIEKKTEACITLKDYIDYCNARVDIENLDSILDSADAFRALANNRAVLIEAVNDYLRRPRFYEKTNTYSSQSLLLAEESTYVVRANFWVKPVEYAADVQWDEQVYAYGFAHNHNFQFMTVGAFGPGYVTDIYEYTPSGNAQPGTHASLKFLERTTLPFGKVMFYRRELDVHTQHPPEAFSASINFMPNNPVNHLTDQLEFDVKTSRVRSVIGSSVVQQVNLLRIASFIGDPSTADVLLAVARSTPNAKVRVAALDSAISLVPAERVSIWRAAANDPLEEVRAVATQRLEALT